MNKILTPLHKVNQFSFLLNVEGWLCQRAAWILWREMGCVAFPGFTGPQNLSFLEFVLTSPQRWSLPVMRVSVLFAHGALSKVLTSGAVQAPVTSAISCPPPPSRSLTPPFPWPDLRNYKSLAVMSTVKAHSPNPYLLNLQEKPR